jgi:hypothetical protein
LHLVLRRLHLLSRNSIFDFYELIQWWTFNGFLTLN